MYIPRTTKLIKLATAGEDDKCNLSITKNREFISFLKKAISPFRKGHLPIDLVLNPLEFNSSPTHLL